MEGGGGRKAEPETSLRRHGRGRPRMGREIISIALGNMPVAVSGETEGRRGGGARGGDWDDQDSRRRTCRVAQTLSFPFLRSTSSQRSAPPRPSSWEVWSQGLGHRKTTPLLPAGWSRNGLDARSRVRSLRSDPRARAPVPARPPRGAPAGEGALGRRESRVAPFPVGLSAVRETHLRLKMGRGPTRKTPGSRVNPETPPPPPPGPRAAPPQGKGSPADESPCPCSGGDPLTTSKGAGTDP